jgi:Ras-related protein Rab-28
MSKAAQEGEVDEEEIENVQFKIILLGDGAVGKTSIAMRFAEDQFSQTYKQTVGVDFFIRRLFIPPKFQTALQIWDIGGQSIGSKMITNYIAGAHAILLCYDITNYESFANLEDWYRLVLRTFSNKQQMPFTALVGNKNDLRHLTAVRVEQHNRFAQENEMASFMMSAKSGDQVKQAFWKGERYADRLLVTNAAFLIIFF